MAFHYWTQPLPNPVSMLFHRLPFWVHKMETYATFVNESFAALFVFAPWPLRLIPFVLFEGLVRSLINGQPTGGRMDDRTPWNTESD
jgi:hypothetical protein